MQVVKDPLKTKGARLSMELTIAGRYMVYAPTGEGIGVSKRLDDKERERLRKEAKGLDLGGGGAIVRTAAQGAKREDFERELQYLHKLYEVLHKRVEEATAPDDGLPGGRPLGPRRARHLLRRLRARARRRREAAPAPRLVLHAHGARARRHGRALPRRRTPLFEKYGVEEVIDGLIDRRVDLPSGGYLMIDYAEALTVIDVNSGSFIGTRQAGPAGGHDPQDEPRGRRGGRQRAAPARHRRHHRHRLHRHGPRAQPRRGAQDAAQVAGGGPHEDVHRRDLQARPRRDDAPERHRGRARDHDAGRARRATARASSSPRRRSRSSSSAGCATSGSPRRRAARRSSCR